MSTSMSKSEYNKKKYAESKKLEFQGIQRKDQVYRQRKKEEDSAAYNRRNADTQKAWRDKYPDRVSLYRTNNIKQRYTANVRQANKKGIPWQKELTEEFYKQMMLSDCYYCGSTPTTTLFGVDRMDNNRSYQINNIVPCCPPCNFTKKALDAKTFIGRALHISKCHDSVGVLDFTLFPRLKTSNANYKSYMTRAVKLEVPFELSKDQFEEIVKYPCVYCDTPRSNGVDRNINDLGYTEKNALPCCTHCNQAKDSNDGNAFIDHMIVIAQYQTLHHVYIPNMLRSYNIVGKRHLDDTRIHDASFVWTQYTKGKIANVDDVHKTTPLMPDLAEAGYKKYLDDTPRPLQDPPQTSQGTES